MGSHESEILYFDCDNWLMTGTKVMIFIISMRKINK